MVLNLHFLPAMGYGRVTPVTSGMDVVEGILTPTQHCKAVDRCKAAAQTKDLLRTIAGLMMVIR